MQEPLTAHTRRTQEREKHGKHVVRNEKKSFYNHTSRGKKAGLLSQTERCLSTQRASKHKKQQVRTVRHMHSQTSVVLQSGGGGGLHMFLTGGSQISLGREPQGSPSQRRAQLRSSSESWDPLTRRHEMKNFVGLHS